MSISLDGPRPKNHARAIAFIVGGVLVAAALVGLVVNDWTNDEATPRTNCVQPEPLVPQGDWESTSAFFEPNYKKKSANLLSMAVQIPTESYDDMALNVTSEPRFEIFKDLHKYLAKHFPKSWRYVEAVNTYGLLYTIPGENLDLKPGLFMAHQDVVPVNRETLDQWKYPPFSGYFDGEFIYGRGAADTKNSLIAILEAIEALLDQKWKPERTVLLSFGFDEEIYGIRGAKQLAAEIFDRYGPSGLEYIVDEGAGLGSMYGSTFAFPAVAEKGRVDFRVILETRGGHSSMPPDHTGIGIMSEFVTSLEDDKIALTLPDGDKGVVLASYACIGEHAADLEPATRKVFQHLERKSNKDALLGMLDSSLVTRGLVGTTQAIDVISGGVKVNALPERVEMLMNHRINLDSSVSSLVDRISKHARALGTRMGLSVMVDNVTIAEGTEGALKVELLPGALEPAPVSPFGGEDKIWNLLGGTTRHVFESVIGSETIIMAPSSMPANTDTAHYWNLTEHIYRFNPVRSEDTDGVHTVNEKLRLSGHLSSVAWFYEFLINSAAVVGTDDK